MSHLDRLRPAAHLPPHRRGPRRRRLTWRWQTRDRVLVTGRAATYAEAVEAAEAARPGGRMTREYPSGLRGSILRASEGPEAAEVTR